MTAENVPFDAANILEAFRGRVDGRAVLAGVLRELSSIEFAEGFADETAGYDRYRVAAKILDDARRRKVIALCAGMGKTEEETEAFLNSAFATGEAEAAPAKPARATKTRPQAPADDVELLKLLIGAIGDGRVGSKGLAGRFAGLNVDRVRRVLADEAAKGKTARVKLEPNGRTWMRQGAP